MPTLNAGCITLRRMGEDTRPDGERLAVLLQSGWALRWPNAASIEILMQPENHFFPDIAAERAKFVDCRPQVSEIIGLRHVECGLRGVLRILRDINTFGVGGGLGPLGNLRFAATVPEAGAFVNAGAD